MNTESSCSLKWDDVNICSNNQINADVLTLNPGPFRYARTKEVFTKGKRSFKVKFTPNKNSFSYFATYGVCWNKNALMSDFDDKFLFEKAILYTNYYPAIAIDNIKVDNPNLLKFKGGDILGIEINIEKTDITAEFNVNNSLVYQVKFNSYNYDEDEVYFVVGSYIADFEIVS